MELEIDRKYKTRLSVTQLNHHELDHVIKAYLAIFHNIYYRWLDIITNFGQQFFVFFGEKVSR